MTRTCMACGAEDCRVVETRLQPFVPFKGNIVRRRRRCKMCRSCWWTVEIPEDLAIELAYTKPEEVLATGGSTFTIGEADDQPGEA